MNRALAGFVSIGLLATSVAGSHPAPAASADSWPARSAALRAEEAAAAPADGWDGISLGGYASQLSVVQGGSVDLHVSTDLPTYTLTIYREGATREVVLSVENLVGAAAPCTDGYATGCGWPVAYTLQVPLDWPSAVYTVDVPTAGAGTRRIVFWVREDAPGSVAPTLFLSSVNTYAAYTNFGGRSLYAFNSPNGDKATRVSFNRPFRNDGEGDFTSERRFVAWAATAGFPLEVATTHDLEFVAGLLSPYRIVVLAGHSEYWTWAMRARLKSFVAGGGRLLNLSGNTMWRQVRYEDGGRTLVTYKDYRADPATTRQTETDNNIDYPILDTPAPIIGAEFASGGNFGVRSADDSYQHEHGLGGYYITRPTHWALAGTGLVAGSVLGRGLTDDTSVIGDEVDGTSFNCGVDGRTVLGPIANTGAPGNLTILATAPASSRGRDRGFATMSIHTNAKGGAVFSANSVGWVNALADPKVARITHNVLTRFLGDTVPAEAAKLDASYLFHDRFNCVAMDHAGLVADYAGPRWWVGVPAHNWTDWAGTGARYTKACGVRGTGLEVKVDPAFRLETTVKSNWLGVTRLYSRMYLRFGSLRIAEGDNFTLFRQLSETGPGSATTVASLLVRRRGGRIELRFNDKTGGGGPPWVAVRTDRAVLVETLWDKLGNRLWLVVDGVVRQASVPLTKVPVTNRVDLVMAGVDRGTSGHVCIDEFAVDDTRIGTRN